MRNKVTTISAALLVTGLGATALFAQEPPTEPRSDEPAANAADQPRHEGMDMGMGMGMGMMDEEMRAQMTRMMENCNRMMEQSLQEESAREE